MRTVAKQKKQSQFSKRLRELRKEAGFTQQQVAESLGVGIQTYMRWERGATEPTFTELAKLAEMFDKTLNDFQADGTDDDPPTGDPPAAPVKPRGK